MTVAEVIQKIASGNPGLAVALLQCQADCEDWAILFQDLLISAEKSSEIYSIGRLRARFVQVLHQNHGAEVHE
jgi:hypothetical protein